MARISTKPKSQIDPIRDVDSHYADLISRHRDLTDRHEAVLAEIAPLSEQQRRSQVSWTTQLPRPKPKPIERHAGGLSLVGDLLPELTLEELNSPAPRPSWPGEDRLRQLGAESEAISEAIKLLAPEISRARKEYSKKVAAQRGAEYTAIVERVVEAAKALGDELLSHHRCINSMRLGGVAWRHLNPVNLNDFGDLDEDFSPLRRLILDAVEKCHVGARQIPDWKMPVGLDRLQGGT